MTAVVRNLFRTTTSTAQPVRPAVDEQAEPCTLGADCLCGRGPAIGTCIATASRLTFRAFHESPAAYHLERVTNWVCVDCLADAALDVANGVVRERMRLDARERAARLEGMGPGQWFDPDPEGNAWPAEGSGEQRLVRGLDLITGTYPIPSKASVVGQTPPSKGDRVM